MLDEGWTDRLEIFFGEASATVCRVYARLDARDPSLRLSGTITGPECPYAQTLPACSKFIDRGAGPSLLAEAVLPEPCFWTPQLPHVYRIALELSRADTPVGRVDRMFGIRPVGPAGRSLYYAGRGWVLRAVAAEEVTADLADWHTADTAMFVRNPDDALCEAASRVGVLLVAEIDTAEESEVRRLARWPAVGFIVLPSKLDLYSGTISGNAILTARFAGHEPIVPPAWAKAALCELTDVERLPRGLLDCPMPLLVKRPAGKLGDIETGRSQCDRLQCDLAARGQFAGYIV